MNDCAGTTRVMMTAERRRMVPLYRLSSKILLVTTRKTFSGVMTRIIASSLHRTEFDSCRFRIQIRTKKICCCKIAVKLLFFCEFKLETLHQPVGPICGLALFSLYLLYVVGPYHASVAADALFSMIALSERWCLVPEEYWVVNRVLRTFCFFYIFFYIFNV